MRYFEILESVSASMKSNQLKSASKNRTVGFEFEFVFKDNISTDELEQYYRNKIPVEKFFNDGFINMKAFQNTIDSMSDRIEPVYGWASEQDYLIQYEKQNPEYFNKLRDIYKRINSLDNLNYQQKVDLLRDIDNLLVGDALEEETIKKVMGTNDKIDEYLNKKKNDELPILPEYASEEKSHKYVYDHDGNIISLKDIFKKGYNAIDEYFTEESVLLMKNIISDMHDDMIYDMMDDELTKGSIEYAFNKVSNDIKRDLNIDVKNYRDVSGSDEWTIVKEENHDDIGLEIISPPFDDTEKALNMLETMLKYIQSNSYMYTNSASSLHVNIGNIDYENVDFFKFLLFIGEENILSQFDRQNNEHTVQLLNDLYNRLTNKKLDMNEYSKIISSINKGLHGKLAWKYFSLNLSKLNSDNGYIELRSIGNANYEYKVDSIKNIVQKFLYVLDIAENPYSYRDVYLKKLYKFIESVQKGKDTTQFNENIGPLNPDDVRVLYDYLTKEINEPKNIAIGKINKMVNSFDEFRNELQMIISSKYKRIDKNVQKVLYKLIKYYTDMYPDKKDKIRRSLYNIAKTNKDLKKLFDEYIMPNLSQT